MIVIARVVASLVLASAVACSSSATSSGGEADPKTGGEATPNPPPPPPPPPPPDFQESRRFSPEHYGSMAKRLVPVEASVERAAAAFIESRLAAIELDFFEDDWYYRPGAIVLIGEERGRLVAFTQRYYADLRYPDTKLIEDGFGTAEIGSQYLDVYERREACQDRRAPGCVTHRFELRPFGEESVDPNVIGVKSFADHDVALLYFPRDAPIVAGRRSMGVENPTRVVEQHLRHAETLFGMHFNLVSDMSLHEMRAHIKVESAGHQLLVMAAGLVVGPVVANLTGQLSFTAEITEKINSTVTKALSAQIAAGSELIIDGVEGAGRDPYDHNRSLAAGLQATDFAADVRLASEAVTDAGSFVVEGSEGRVEVPLAGVAGPRSAEERAELRRYLAAVVGSTVAKVDLRGDDGKTRAMLVIPGEKLNLNYELLRHGLVRLDTGDVRALRSFPELVVAADAALEAGTGFAREWKGDVEYALAVATARLE